MSQPLTVKEFLVPVIVAIIVGTGSGYISTQSTLAVLETRIQVNEKEITELKRIYQAVQHNQLELAARGEWIKKVEHELKSVDKRLNRIEGIVYKAPKNGN